MGAQSVEFVGRSVRWSEAKQRRDKLGPTEGQNFGWAKCFSKIHHEFLQVVVDVGGVVARAAADGRTVPSQVE